MYIKWPAWATVCALRALIVGSLGLIIRNNDADYTILADCVFAYEQDNSKL